MFTLYQIHNMLHSQIIDPVKKENLNYAILQLLKRGNCSWMPEEKIANYKLPCMFL